MKNNIFENINSFARDISKEFSIQNRSSSMKSSNVENNKKLNNTSKSNIRKNNNKQLMKEKKELGVIEEITEEITSVKLKQAIILTEIIGRPACKKRRENRRYR